MNKKPTLQKSLLSTIVLILILAMTACGQTPEVEEAPPQPESPAPVETTPEPDPLPDPDPEPEYEPAIIPGGPYAGSFAFGDESGTRLMILPDTSHSVGNNPESLDVAIGAGGKMFKVKYAGIQEGTGDPGDYIRPSAQNFDAISGHVYELASGKLELNTPYFVTTSDVFAKTMIPIKTEASMAWSEKPMPVARDSAIKKHESEKGLEVIYSETLATVGADGYLELFQYERVGDDMLFEIVYDDGTHEVIASFPAEYKEYSTWRVDAGDSPGIWIPLFVCDIEGTLVMSTLWAAPESGSLSVWFEDNGEWTGDEYLSTYWHWG